MADQSFFRHDCHIDIHAIPRTAIDLNDTGPGCRLTANHPCGHKIELRSGLLITKQRTQTLIFCIVFTGMKILDAQLFDLIAQHLILLMHRGNFPDVARHIIELASHPGNGTLERRHHDGNRLIEDSARNLPRAEKKMIQKRLMRTTIKMPIFLPVPLFFDICRSLSQLL